MRTSLFVVALCCCGLALTAGAAATPVDERITNNTTDGDGEVGICVIGVDSPCNGEQYDGDDDRAADNGTSTPVDPGEDRNISASPENGSGEVGVCMIGVDSPCNGEQYDGDDDRSPANGTTAPVDEGTRNVSEGGGDAIGGGSAGSGGVGICLVGADSPCNSDRWRDVPVGMAPIPEPDVVADVLRMFGLPTLA